MTRTAGATNTGPSMQYFVKKVEELTKLVSQLEKQISVLEKQNTEAQADLQKYHSLFGITVTTESDFDFLEPVIPPAVESQSKSKSNPTTDTSAPLKLADTASLKQTALHSYFCKNSFVRSHFQVVFTTTTDNNN